MFGFVVLVTGVRVGVLDAERHARAARKIRSSGTVPYRLTWVRGCFTSSGRMGWSVSHIQRSASARVLAGLCRGRSGPRPRGRRRRPGRSFPRPPHEHSERCRRMPQPELARSALPCAGSVFLVAEDPVAAEAELARLRAENARLLQLLRLSPQQAAPPVPGQAAFFEASPGVVHHRSPQEASCPASRGPPGCGPRTRRRPAPW